MTRGDRAGRPSEGGAEHQQVALGAWRLRSGQPQPPLCALKCTSTSSLLRCCGVARMAVRAWRAEARQRNVRECCRETRNLRRQNRRRKNTSAAVGG
eukprot:2754858-Rhodomonas_salina.1